VSPSPLDSFIPAPDARERFAVTARAPAALVYEVAATFDMQSHLVGAHHLPDA
jgi:hypothetical protein